MSARIRRRLSKHAPFIQNTMAHIKHNRFATYRIAISRVIAVTTFLVISFLATLPEVSRAQCPDPSWTYCSAPQFVLIPPNCIEEVYYCWKVIGGQMNFIIEYVQPDQWDSCNTLPPAELIIDAVTGFETNPPNPADIFIPPCGEGSVATYEYQVCDCWEVINNNYAQNDPRAPVGAPCGFCSYFGVCPGSTSECQTTCFYCQDPVSGAMVEQSCSSVNIWNADCVQSAPIQLSQWAAQQCYNINPCGN
jgi:hypothetical protein